VNPKTLFLNDSGNRSRECDDPPHPILFFTPCNQGPASNQMTSTLGWIEFSSEHREKVRSIIDFLSPPGVVRDTFADAQLSNLNSNQALGSIRRGTSLQAGPLGSHGREDRHAAGLRDRPLPAHPRDCFRGRPEREPRHGPGGLRLALRQILRRSRPRCRGKRSPS